MTYVIEANDVYWKAILVLIPIEEGNDKWWRRRRKKENWQWKKWPDEKMR